MRTVIGLYEHLENVKQAVDALAHEGFPEHTVSLVAGDEEGMIARELHGIERGDDEHPPAGLPEDFHEVLGGLRALVLPDAGHVHAAGPLTAALVGAVTRGLADALRDLGVPGDDAQELAQGVRQGESLLVVATGTFYAERAAVVMNRFGPVDLDLRLQQSGAPGLPVTGGRVEEDLRPREGGIAGDQQPRTGHPSNASHSTARSYIREKQPGDAAQRRPGGPVEGGAG